MYTYTQISCLTPTGADLGLVNVSVVLRYRFTKRKMEFLSGQTPLTFRYQRRPSVSGVDPKSGSSRGGTVLTITGSDFENSNLLRVRFATSNASSWMEIKPEYRSSTSLMVETPRCVVPGACSGFASVEVSK